MSPATTQDRAEDSFAHRSRSRRGGPRTVHRPNGGPVPYAVDPAHRTRRRGVWKAKAISQARSASNRREARGCAQYRGSTRAKLPIVWETAAEIQSSMFRKTRSDRVRTLGTCSRNRAMKRGSAPCFGSRRSRQGRLRTLPLSGAGSERSRRRSSVSQPALVFR